MTKPWHTCPECEGKNGKFLKICMATGEAIEDYQLQLKRQIEDLYTKEHKVGDDERSCESGRDT